MHTGKIIHMSVERDGKGAIVVKSGGAVATWIAPVAIHFFRASKPVNFWEWVGQEVLARAALDALGHTPPLRNTRSPYERQQTIAEAQDWFQRAGADYQEMCELAGMPPLVLRDAVLGIVRERKIA